MGRLGGFCSRRRGLAYSGPLVATCANVGETRGQRRARGFPYLRGVRIGAEENQCGIGAKERLYIVHGPVSALFLLQLLDHSQVQVALGTPNLHAFRDFGIEPLVQPEASLSQVLWQEHPASRS